MDFNKIPQLEFLQPNKENIWLICAKPVSTTKYATYSVFPSNGLYKNPNIIIDIDNFLTETSDKALGSFINGSVGKLTNTIVPTSLITK